MKKRFKIICIVIICMLFPMGGIANKVSLGIGFYTWYSWWNSAWSKIYGSKNMIYPDFLYGPAINVGLPKGFAISSMFLYGKFNVDFNTEHGGNWGARDDREDRILRYDSDTAISYSPVKFFKIFLGFKYMQYNIKCESYYFPNATYGFYSRYKNLYREFSPGLGIGFTIKLIDYFYLLINSTTLYNFSYQENFRNEFSIGIATATYPPLTKRIYLNKIGLNVNLTFAYHIKKINTTITVGGRFQMYKTLTGREDNQYNYLDLYYGITASILYRFDFKRKGDVVKKENETD